MKRVSFRRLRWFLLGLAIAGPAVGVVIWVGVIPRVIVAAIHERHAGHVSIQGWWISTRSAGVTGLELHEQDNPDSPIWALADRVSTDLSWGAILRGRFTPRRIAIEGSHIRFRIDEQGQPATRIPFRQTGGGEIPEVVVRESRLTLAQEGRPEMRVEHLSARLTPRADGPVVEASADEPGWGNPHLEGQLAPALDAFRLRLTADHLPADLERAISLPFVDESVWKYVTPAGPVGIVLDCASSAESGKPVHAGGERLASATAPASLSLTTTVIMQGATVGLPTLALEGRDATGRITIKDKVVGLQDVHGRMVGGNVSMAGMLDFSREAARYDLALGLEGVDLNELPESWQLQRLDIEGRFTGNAGLRLRLTEGGLDVTGSTGEGRIDGAVVRGIPLERLELSLRGDGLRSPETAGRRAGAAGPPRTPGPGSGEEGPFLPQWVSANFRVAGVELRHAWARIQTPDQKGPREIPVSGRLNLQASMQLPLGELTDLAAYRAQGTLDVAAATIGDLDLGRLAAGFGLEGGVLDLGDIRGRIVARPPSGERPAATDPPPVAGPLPPGGFRGRVRAELAGERNLRVEMEAVELPIDELLNVSPSMAPPSAPPALHGLPLAGRVSIRATARAAGADSWDPGTWSLSGQAEAPEVSYQSIKVTGVTSGVAIERGKLVLNDLKGRLEDAPLKGRATLDLAEPWSYHAELETGDVSCRKLLDLVPSAPRPDRIEGKIAGRGEATGTLSPWRIASSGEAKVSGLAVGKIGLGEIPVRWITRSELITLTADEHQRYGGRVSAEARVPVGFDHPIEGTITLTNVDAAELSAAAPESWRLTGHAGGQARFRIGLGGSAGRRSDDSLPIDAEAHLKAEDLTVRGVPARSVAMNLEIRHGVPRYDVRADGLGGTIHLAGDGRLASDAKEDEVRAQVEALGLRLYEVWGLLGTPAPLSDLRGQVSVRGKVEAKGGFSLEKVRGTGSVELVDLIYGFDYGLGTRIKSGLSKTASGWRFGPFEGEVFGGRVGGKGLWMYTDPQGRERYGVDARVEKILLARALNFLPDAERRFSGTGTLHVRGRSDGALGGSGAFRVERGYVNSLEMNDLSVPGDWTFSAGPPRQGRLVIRQAEGRLAGGRVGGEAQFILGERRDFHARLFVDDVDLRVISRETLGTRPVPGRLSGYVNISGADPLQPASYRGEVEFDLDQASLVDIPLLDELDRSLGSVQGGVFDDGDVHATIADRKLHINQMTLVGPLAQVHATGSLDFDGRMNLEVVVYDNKGIPEAGQAMLARSPSVADAVARRASQIDQVSDLLSARLMKFRITGTIKDPIVTVDRSINARGAIGFFLRTMSLSMQNREDDSKPGGGR